MRSMPELPEVETIRRMLESTVRGRTIRDVKLSGLALRCPVPASLARHVKGRTIEGVGRHGKYLLIELDGGWTLLSHLGMSGRWLFYPERPREDRPHVHAQVRFQDGSQLWFQDARRFGLLRAVRTDRLGRDASLATLGPDPVLSPPGGERLYALGRDARVHIKLPHGSATPRGDREHLRERDPPQGGHRSAPPDGHPSPRRLGRDREADGAGAGGGDPSLWDHVSDVSDAVGRARHVRRAAPRLRPREPTLSPVRHPDRAHRAGTALDVLLPILPAPARPPRHGTDLIIPARLRGGAAFVVAPHHPDP